MKKLIIAIFIFLTSMSFAANIAQNINTESQQALYTQLIDSKIDNINTKVDIKIDNIKTDFDNKTKNLDNYAFYVTAFLGLMALVSIFGGVLSWRYFQDKKSEIDKIINEIKQNYDEVKQIGEETKEDKAEIQEDLNKLDLESVELKNNEQHCSRINDGNVESSTDQINSYDGVTSVLEDEDDHFPAPKYDEIKKLYLLLRKELLSLGKDVEVESKKFYLAFKRSGKNFVDVRTYQGHLTCFLNFHGKLVDPNNLAKSSYKWSNRPYEYKIREQSDIMYFITLAKQSYDDKIR